MHIYVAEGKSFLRKWWPAPLGPGVDAPGRSFPGESTGRYIAVVERAGVSNLRPMRVLLALSRIIGGGLVGGTVGALIAVPFVALSSVLVSPDHLEPGMVVGLVGMVTAMVGFVGGPVAGLLIRALLLIAARKRLDIRLVPVGTVVASSPGAIALVVFYSSNFDAAMGWVAAYLALVWMTAATYFVGRSASRLIPLSAPESPTDDTTSLR